MADRKPRRVAPRKPGRAAAPPAAEAEVLDARQLRNFLAVVASGHFGRAATQLGISKQGLSQSVAALEAALGVRLFERGQFGAVPTEFGKVLTQHAKVMESEARKARSEIEGLREEHRGEVTFALGSSFSEFIAPAAIMRFRQAHPKVVLKIANVHPDNMLQLLVQGELDFVAMGDLGSMATAGLERRELFRMTSHVIVPARHPLARKRKPALQDLSAETFIGVWRHDLTARTMVNAFRKAKAALPAMIDCDNFSVTRGLVLEHGCLVIANRLFFEREIEAGRVVEVDVPDLCYEVSYALFTRKDSIHGRAMSALMGELENVAREKYGRDFLDA